jgi:hypothetical protein
MSKRLTFQQLHDGGRLTFFFTDIVNSTDIGMVECR